MATYLDDILAVHRARAAADDRTEAALASAIPAASKTRGFAAAIRQSAGVAVIAEFKRRSPSKGPLAPDLDPAAVAMAYEAGGATCLSVLTDGPHFAGAPADLIAARAATALPVLRKDFTVDRRDLFDARIMGADAILLIVAALSDSELVDLLTLGSELDLECLVEIHDEEELIRAVDAGASMIGVNQRDLRTFSVDPARARRLAPLIPDGIVRVAESGISRTEEVVQLAEVGFDAILVGEALVTSGDPTKALRMLLAGSMIRG